MDLKFFLILYGQFPNHLELKTCKVLNNENFIEGLLLDQLGRILRILLVEENLNPLMH